MTPHPLHPTEADERRHLESVRSLVVAELERFTGLVLAKNAEARYIKKYIQENKGDMDHAEKVSTRNSADQVTAITEHSDKRNAPAATLPHGGSVTVFTMKP